MTELTKTLGKSYEKLTTKLRKTYEHGILIVDKSKHRVKWRIFFLSLTLCLIKRVFCFVYETFKVETGSV